MQSRFEHISKELEVLAGRLPPIILAEVGERLKEATSIHVTMEVVVERGYNKDIEITTSFRVNNDYHSGVRGTTLAAAMEEHLRRMGWTEENKPIPQTLMLAGPKGGEDEETF